MGGIGHLTVRVEAVDAELDLGEDATGGIQLAHSYGRLYHLRNVEVEPAGGAVTGRIRLLKQSEKKRLTHCYKAELGRDLKAVGSSVDSEIAPFLTRWKHQASVHPRVCLFQRRRMAGQ